MGFLELQQGAKDGHFKKGIYYELLRSLSVENPDDLADGAPFNYKQITDERTLAYLGAHISIHQNEVVIETYAPISWELKSKVRLEGQPRILQVKTITPMETVISPIARIVKYTITLG